MPTLIPTGGKTYCTVETGSFSNTYDGSVATQACFKKNQSGLSEWYWNDPVTINKFSIRAHNYHQHSRINVIYGRVFGKWVPLWGGVWHPKHGMWDSKTLPPVPCTGIRIHKTHSTQTLRPCISEVKVDYTPAPPPPEEGKATITSVSKPSTFTPGELFTIRTVVRNDGGADKLFIKLIDKDTGSVLKEFTTTTAVSSGGTWTYSINMRRTQKTDFHARIEVGHIK